MARSVVSLTIIIIRFGREYLREEWARVRGSRAVPFPNEELGDASDALKREMFQLVMRLIRFVSSVHGMEIELLEVLSKTLCSH